jgi:hypothetical protein
LENKKSLSVYNEKSYLEKMTLKGAEYDMQLSIAERK